ncbi:hypothetical protein [Sulfurovum sp.]|uniref:acyltransferase n=1 Tax=Sulfurovum sp. TaxID=1969726 RepID=UPI003562FA27
MIKAIFLGLIEGLLRNISGPLGRKLRYLYYKQRFASCGDNVYIDEGVIFERPEFMYIGNNVWIDKNCLLIAGKSNSLGKENSKLKVNKNFKLSPGILHMGDNIHIAPFCILQAHGGLFIDDNCGFSANVKLYTLSNLPSNPTNKSELVTFSPLKNPYYLSSPIVLNKNVGISLNSIVLPGVTIGENSFIAPNSVVMTTIKENSFASGNPAKKTKNRFDLEEIE